MHAILFRHATKERSFDANPGLSVQGQAEAEEILRLVNTGVLPRPTQIFCSPKKRTSETMLPLARALQISIQVTEELDERKNHERVADFLERIEAFLLPLQDAYQVNDVIYICSHMDWLEEAMTIIPSSDNDDDLAMPFQAAEYRSFAISNHQGRKNWKLIRHQKENK